MLERYGEAMVRQRASTPRRDPLWVIAWVLAIAAATALTWLTLISLVPPFPAIVAAATFGATATCVTIAVWLSPRPLSWAYAAPSAVMGLLGGLAPIALVLFLRITASTSCIVINVFGLPWSAPWQELLHWGSGALCIIAPIALITAVTRPALRGPAIAMLGYWVLMALPTSVLWFLSVFGDPAPGC